MDQNKTIDKKTALYISILLIVAAFTRFWHLDYQSLWLDEMHTMVFCSPNASWSYFVQSVGADVHPPLHYAFLKVLFSIFGYTEWVARMPSAIAGVLSVGAVFLLGRELYNNKLGLLAAFITAINYYGIYFSQEARNYMFAFLFVTLSFLYFIRIIKKQNLSNSILYGLFTLLLLYSHYYSVFVITAQILLGLLFFITDTTIPRIKFVKFFAISAAIVIIGFLPWLPFITSVTDAQSTWISLASDSFMVDYFFEYFGNSGLLKPILTISLTIYILYVIRQKTSFSNIQKEPFSFSFIILFIWIILSYLLPYLRSILALPMLYARYTIIALPAFILAISFGLILINNKTIQILTLTAFLSFSIVDIGLTKEYYTKVSKSQYREMIRNVAENNPDNYPIINTLSQTTYYTDKYNIHAPMLFADKETAINNVLAGVPGYDAKGFWILGGHHSSPIDVNRKKELEAKYTHISTVTYYDAWAELYISKSDTGLGCTYLTPQDLASGNATVDPGSNVISLWTGSIKFKALEVEKGEYRVIVCARGTTVKDIFPILEISLNGKKMATMYTSAGRTLSTFDWKNTSGTPAIFDISYINDASRPAKNEDRNAFIYYIMLKRLN